MTNYDHDIVTIGVGPAGKVISSMASEMGMNVCAIEKGLNSRVDVLQVNASVL